ncbi:hypothetical protein IWQ62_001139 [Dispira parvispora]|uniref:Uncharacterized protein n=1 Tax=Dispira parvispora TaxID=1520584 RepID=A0A9W8E8I5_9FUNG|nr:hypothetical protein IWQ62_001139 [Dispira parvispora]
MQPTTTSSRQSRHARPTQHRQGQGKRSSVSTGSPTASNPSREGQSPTATFSPPQRSRRHERTTKDATNRPKPPVGQSTPTVAALPEFVSIPSEFICLEAPPPVFRDPQSERLVSPVQAYADWVALSLSIFSTVTIIGVGSAIPCVIGIAVLCQTREIPEQTQITTFSNEISRSQLSCCQVQFSCTH